jgi:hypothetical protein
MNFKGKKTPNMNSFNQMKPFDTNIVYFGGQNQCERPFLSLLPEFSNLYLSSLNQGLINNKNRLWYQN